MSAAPPDDLPAAFRNLPSPEEIDMMLTATAPVGDVMEMGSALGEGMQHAPGSGPKAVGMGIEYASSIGLAAYDTAELTARLLQMAIDFHVGGLEAVFPPPDVAIAQVRQDFEPLRELLVDGPPLPPPPE